MGLKKYLSSDNHTAMKINENISRIFQIKRSCLQRILEITDCSCLHRLRIIDIELVEAGDDSMCDQCFVELAVRREDLSQATPRPRRPSH